MNFVIDFGNTYTKFALFDNEKQIDSFSIINDDYKQIESLIKTSIRSNHSLHVMVSSVIPYPEPIKTILKNNSVYFEFNHLTPIPVSSKFKTPETLGKDRLAAAVGANYLYPETNILVIDAGTCITYDFINSKNEFLGGSISPGMNMRFNSIHHYTANLPLITPKNTDLLTGSTTEESILTGIINGITAEIEGIIEKYKKQYNTIHIVITGGDHMFFEKKINCSIFAIPNLVLIGLNVILNYNAKK